MRTYIDIFLKESEEYVAYPEQSTVHFENVANITVGRDSLIPQEKKLAVRKIVRKIVKLLTAKMKQLRLLYKTREFFKQNASKAFLTCLDNILAETK